MFHICPDFGQREEMKTKGKLNYTINIFSLGQLPSISNCNLLTEATESCRDFRFPAGVKECQEVLKRA